MSDSAHDLPRRLPPRYRVAVRRIEWLTPRVANLTLHGPELSGFEPAAAGSHVKLILPSSGDTDTPQPLRHEGFRAVFAEGVTPPFLRTYTPLRYNPERMELEVEMVCHGDSPASNWLRAAKAGHRIIVAGPRGGWNPPTDGDWYLVMADDTGIPAAVQVLAALPGRPRQALFEVSDEAERRALPGIPDDLPKWLFREPEVRPAGALLEEVVRSGDLPAGRGYVWMALEAGAMRRIRRYLLEDVRLPSEQMVTRGYWKLGDSDHPDGDYGTE